MESRRCIAIGPMLQRPSSTFIDRKLYNFSKEDKLETVPPEMIGLIIMLDWTSSSVFPIVFKNFIAVNSPSRWQIIEIDLLAQTLHLLYLILLFPHFWPKDAGSQGQTPPSMPDPEELHTCGVDDHGITIPPRAPYHGPSPGLCIQVRYHSCGRNPPWEFSPWVSSQHRPYCGHYIDAKPSYLHVKTERQVFSPTGHFNQYEN